jgi:bisphosphoglycerate-independent phosphoglycerate mutase (AlkP superfamily)
MHKTVMIFVDGLGLAPANDETNPVNQSVCPALTSALQNHAIPIDAALGVQGIPQSATGQTALLTGINAPQAIGRHVEGFPGPSLRKIICKHSIFEQLQQKDLPSTFANGYLARTTEQVHNMRIKSVTTVAALAAFGDVRRADMLEKHQAVSHDIIRDTLHTRGYSGEQISEKQAAQDLITIAEQHAFTLFEYFLTDRAGHTMNMEKSAAALSRLDSFMAELLKLSEKSKVSIILTSDHGNIEDLSTRSHTLNPVPFLVCGPASGLKEKVKSLTDITPAIVEMLEKG